MSDYLDQIRELTFEGRSWTPEQIEEMRDFLSPFNHNIRLAPGIYTAALEEWYPEHRTVMQLIDRHLRGGYAGVRVLDLGCLEGYYSLECALHGATVLGVDAKAINVKKCEFAKSVLNAANATFVLDDAIEVTRERYGPFEVVLALGLLYHLDDPFTFLRHVADICGDGFIVLDTLVALEAGPQTIDGWTPELSELREFRSGAQTYRGRLYREFEHGADEEEREFSTTASHRNDLSLWLTEESLVRALAAAGFEQIEKVVFPAAEDNWWSAPDDGRVLYVAGGPSAFASSFF